MVTKKYALLSILILAAAGCADVPLQGCPAKTPVPVVAPAAAPVAAPAPTPAPIAPVQQAVLQSKPVTITGIHFKFNSSQLLGHDIRVLDEVANFAQKHPDAVLDVNGYCSKVGSYAYNQKLSEQRAESVARYLKAHGVPGSRMMIKGHSYKDPIASNATSQGRFQNQRVEINSTIQVEKTDQGDPYLQAQVN
jgi:OOP family OmpA-OmpF porin